MEPVAWAMGFILVLGGGIGCVPIALLFVDYRKRGELHKPFIWLAAFGITFAVLLPTLLRWLGIWIALVAPFALLAAVFAARRRVP